MSTIRNVKPGELSFEEIESIIEQARKMRSQALANIGTALWSVLTRGFHCAGSHLRAVVGGHRAEKCA